MRVALIHWLICVSIINNYNYFNSLLVAATIGIGVYWASKYFIILLNSLFLDNYNYYS
jgi:hypothetical protein